MECGVCRFVIRLSGICLLINMAKKQGQRPKHVPQRTCIVCRQKTDKRRLTRIVYTPENQVVVDKSGKQNGRGAYVCDQVECWQKMTSKPGILNQALKTTLSSESLAEIAAHTPKTAVADNNLTGNRTEEPTASR